MTTTPAGDTPHQVTADDRTNMRQRHVKIHNDHAFFDAESQAKWEPYRCELDDQPWPCDTVRLLEVADTANAFCATWRETFMVMPDDYGMTMQCDEAEAAADLYRALGRAGEAESLLDDHAEHDTEEDSHYDRGVWVQQRRDVARAAGGSTVPGS
jgi:hypothetical protein